MAKILHELAVGASGSLVASYIFEGLKAWGSSR
jgi:hypothetical protein